MKKMLIIAFASIMACAAVAQANTFTADGGLLEPSHGYNIIADRLLVNDGDFEGGTCLETPIWTCTSDNGCDWIADLVPLGLWNYSGMHIAWLGGFCGGLATCFTTICQEIYIDGCFLSWFWMAYVNDGGREISITIDGEVIYTCITHLDDPPEYQQSLVLFDPSWYGLRTVCFEYHNEADCGANIGDNYFFDYVEISGITPSGAVSFSVIKSLY